MLFLKQISNKKTIKENCECSECKPKLIKTTNQNKGNILTSQSELEVNIRNWLQARKNAGDQVSAGWVVRVS